ncbi:MAG: c-type cytochrome [Candidatus Binatia bacterium]
MRRVRREVMGLGAALLMIAAGLPAIAAEAPEVYEKKCKLCHSIQGEGGKQAEKGGKLDGVGAKRDAAWLKAYIEDPKSKMPDAKMPKLKLAPEELDALVAYMLTLK